MREIRDDGSIKRERDGTPRVDGGDGGTVVDGAMKEDVNDEDTAMEGVGDEDHASKKAKTNGNSHVDGAGGMSIRADGSEEGELEDG